MEFKVRLIDRLVEARIVKEPFIIVEGKDDRQIYSRLVNEINKEAKVHAVAEFEDFHAGCENVIQCMEQLQQKLINDPINQRFVLGIIDRDSRPFKGGASLAELLNLYILRHYSIETYFATSLNLSRLIEKSTYATLEDVDQEIIAFVLANVPESFSTLYYISLDALKQECLGLDTYKASVAYGDDDTGSKVSRQFREHFEQNVLPERQADLDLFALDKEITIDDLKLIAKGKWYLYNYLYRAGFHIKKLHEKCLANELRSGRHYGDIFKLRIERNPDQLVDIFYQDILQFIDHEECSDIVEAINSLA